MGSKTGHRAGLGQALLLIPALVVLLTLPALLFAAPASADTNICTTGSGAAQCERPQGIALDPGRGVLYVADRDNNRVDAFDAASGAFEFAFGGGVADGNSIELQTCHATCFKGVKGGGPGQFGAGEQFGGVRQVAVDASSHAVYAFGDGRVQRFVIDENGTPADPSDDFAVFDRAWGGGVVTGGATGSGDLESGSTTISNVKTASKRFEVGQAISGAGILAGTKIVGLGKGTIALSKAVTTTGTGVALTVAEGAGNVPMNEVQVFKVLELPTYGEQARVHFTFTTPAPSATSATTEINFSTSPPASGPGSVQESLENLPNVGAGNVSVSGPAGGPYTIEFKGARFADTNVPQLEFTGVGKLALETVRNGAGSPEICTALHPEDCAVGKDGNAEGQFGDSSSDPLAVGTDGTVYVGDNRPIGGRAVESSVEHRVEKFEPSGAFVGQLPFPRGNAFITGLAVESSGNFYLSLGGLGKYDPSGNLLSPSPADGETVAVDDADNLFAFGSSNGLNRIAKLDPAGTILYDAYPEGQGGRVGVAPDTVGGGAFVSDGQSVFRLPPPPPGPVVPRPPTVEGVRSARATLGAFVDPEGKATSYRFQYVTEATYQKDLNELGPGHGFDHATETSPVAVGSDFAPHSVSAKIEGLAPETSYRFRVVASNADGSAASPEGSPFTTLDPLEIGAAWSTDVGFEEARLHAEVNPLGTPATGYFEYVEAPTCLADEEAEGPGHCFDHARLLPDVEAAAPPLDFGSGETPKAATRLLLALAPGTAYRYRIVVHDHCKPDPEAICTFAGPARSFQTLAAPGEADTDCPNQAFRTGPSAHLPDCRAYEMVSPVDKNNSDISRPEAFSDLIDQAAGDGEALTFAAVAATFADPAGSPAVNQYLAQRDGASGWSTRSIAAPRTSVALILGGGTASPFKLFSEDLCSGWELQATDVPLVEGAPRGVPNLYRHHGLREGCREEGVELLTPVFPPGYDPAIEQGESKYRPRPQGFSADGDVSVIRAAAALTEDASEQKTDDGSTGIYQLYAYEDGALRLVSILPGGKAAATNSTAGTIPVESGEILSSRQDSLYHAVSADGSKVYWTTGDTHSVQQIGGRGPGKLYLRLNPTAEPSAVAQFTGTGKLTQGSREVGSLVAAKGTGTLTAGSPIVTSLSTTVGQFVVGQPLNQVSGKIPPGTTITEVSPTTLTLSAPAEAGGSATLSSKGPAPFEAGQAISGAGIAPGTTILAAETGKLILSTAAEETKATVALTASSCSEPEAACTLAVSAQAETLSDGQGARFLSAAADGSRAIFSVGEDLYEYDLPEALAKEDATHLIAHHLKGIMGASADASRVYLVSSDELDAGAIAGRPNLYFYERGSGPSFIATIPGLGTSAEGNEGGIHTDLARRTARVSPDGADLVFSSSSSALAEAAAGYDNADAASGEPDREVYLYNSDAKGGEGALVCASCNPTGARPAGQLVEKAESGKVQVWVAARIPGWVTSVHPGNLLSADGRRLFFESFEALVPRDTNGRQDVYEWEAAASEEQCLATLGGELYVPQSGGCLGLISSGQGSEDAQFIDASADGRDVFFLTGSSLLPQDEAFRDIYDARSLGGFPPPPQAPPACEGEACQSPPAAPNDPTPASSTFRGAGNLAEEAPPSCRKPKIRRKGRCVAKRNERRHRRGGHNRKAAR